MRTEMIGVNPIDGKLVPRLSARVDPVPFPGTPSWAATGVIEAFDDRVTGYAIGLTVILDNRPASRSPRTVALERVPSTSPSIPPALASQPGRYEPRAVCGVADAQRCLDRARLAIPSSRRLSASPRTPLRRDHTSCRSR